MQKLRDFVAMIYYIVYIKTSFTELISFKFYDLMDFMYLHAISDCVNRVYSRFDNFSVSATAAMFIKLDGLIFEQGRIYRRWCVCTGTVLWYSDLVAMNIHTDVYSAEHDRVCLH